MSTVKAVLENALQEELTAFLQGRVLSVNAVNQITLYVQRQQEARQTGLLSQTPEIILVDGVWVEIQYVIPDEYEFGQSGHLRQCRKSEKRVVLAVMVIWADGRSELLHYEVADGESEATWNRLFKNLIARGFDVNALKLVSSDGSLGIPQAINNYFLTLTFYQFNQSLHKHIRTTNHLERLFREFRTKSDEIGVFPNEISCLTVFWLVS